MTLIIFAVLLPSLVGTTFSLVPPTARMHDCGEFMMAVKCDIPNIPRFDIVIVPPMNSCGCNLPSLANEIVVEMVFQLGKTGVSKFHNFLAALRDNPPQWLTASEEMLDSRWAKQTPNRAGSMSEIIASLA